MEPQKTAIIYIRWSTLEQTKGDSYTRQINATSKFCENNGYTVLDTVRDEGRSAWTGENIHTGNLGKLVDRFKRKEFPEGTVVVVEQLDRLTRLPALDVISWLTGIFPFGITFVTTDKNQMISREAMDADQTSFLSLIFDTFRSNAESARKSVLLLESWKGRREDVQSGKRRNITGVCPAWMRWDKEKADFVLITHPTNWRLDRRKIIQRIFNQADEGVGYVMIAKRLNEDRVPAWGIGKRASDGWHTSYIHKILRNPAVVGEFQPQSRRKGMIRGIAVGDPLPDYYPQVISHAQFDRVASRRAKVNIGGASKGIGRKNLLAGLVYCGRCNARMNFAAKGNAGRERTNPKTGTVTIDKNDYLYLRCSGAVRGHKCDHKEAFNYRLLQEALLDGILHLALDDAHFQHGERVEEIEDQVAAARRELARLEQQAEAALDMTLDPAFKHDARVKQRYVDASTRANDQSTHLEELGIALTKAKGAVSPNEHVSRVKAVRTAIGSEDEVERDAARTKVMDALQAIVTGIRFMPDRTIIVTAAHGAVNFKFDDKGNLLQKIDLTVGMHEERLRAGIMNRDGIERPDIAKDIQTVRARSAR